MPVVDELRSILATPLRALLALGASAVLAACTTVVPAEPEIREVRVEVRIPVPVVEPGDVAMQQFLAYSDRLRQMTPAELTQEVAAKNNDAALSPQAATQLALALSYTHANGDAPRAQALIDQVLRNNAPEAQTWQSIARLISPRFSEQRRYEEQIERLNQQARDSQRESQRKLDQLNEKLEALKAIERSLNSPRAASVPPSSSASSPKPAHP